MVATIGLNPYNTTNASGSFAAQSAGYIQGTALDQPAIRNSLAGGVLATSETIPMWGGVAINEQIPGLAASPREVLGGTITRAANYTVNAAGCITGFSVFDQNYAAVNNPGSPVPLIPSNGQVNFYRLGSGARIAVKCSANLALLEGGSIGQKVSWDFANQQLEPYASTTISSGTYPAAATISSGTYNATTGAVSLTTNAAHGLLPGDTFSLNTMAGTGAFASFNGTWVATAGTTGSTLNFTAATGLVATISGGNLGTIGISLTTAAASGLNPGDTFEISGTTGTGNFANINGEQTAAGGSTGTTLRFLKVSDGSTSTITGGTIGSGGAIPVQVLDVQVGNSMTVAYDAGTNTAKWNRSDSTAIILI